MGGMAAFIPVKDDRAKNEQAFANVRADKQREANDGHDGTWVAHPGMVELATEAFNAVMPQPNQIDRKRDHPPCQHAFEQFRGRRRVISMWLEIERTAAATGTCIWARIRHGQVGIIVSTL